MPRHRLLPRRRWTMGSADPNPNWTRAPWAGVPQPVSRHAHSTHTAAAVAPLPRDRVSGEPQRVSAATERCNADAALMPPPAPRPPRETAADAEPLWVPYFHTALDVPIGADCFRVYLAGREGPLALCLHGAGMTALTFATATPALVAAARCRVAALDMRGHGASATTDEADLSAERLVADVVAVAHALLHRAAAEDAACAAAPSAPPLPLLLVGHSMGGSVAARVAASGALPTLCGVAVLDIVEGTAQAAAPAMRALLAQRPRGFADVAAARAWARAPPGPSLPSQLVTCGEGAAVTWRTPLQLTEPFWEGWFRGLSATFLATRLPKLLLLADTDRLDDTLTIAQMQGRFQLILVPGAGHALHEDAPDTVAAALAAFVRRATSASAPAPCP